ncbi:MAG: molybdopterin-dependent oxidoreductase [Anaerolineales bacterium]|nr:molybdopterin-dependent oxidoreductase [Anaerolineales bacterium]MCB8951336.1 molybdopterin-dependent oxidoreductase [Ardenticatenales bacterium]
MLTHDPLQPHSHDPNPHPPGADAAFWFVLPDAPPIRLTPADLQTLPRTTLPDCYIVSTGHGTSGPFVFAGTTLYNLLTHYLPPGKTWSQVDIISGDSFGTRILAAEVIAPGIHRPILLSDTIDGAPMSRQNGLVRLIVPGETDDALRQVKWIARVVVRP